MSETVETITPEEAYAIIVKESDKDKDLIKEMLQKATSITLFINRELRRWRIEVW